MPNLFLGIHVILLQFSSISTVVCCLSSTAYPMSDGSSHQNPFPFVHDSISSVLLAPSSTTTAINEPHGARRIWFEQDHTGNISGIRNSQTEQGAAVDVSLEDLVALARQADELIYGTRSGPFVLDSENKAPVDPWLGQIQVLSSNGPCNYLVLSLLVTLNNLESSIFQSSIGTSARGKAPLLKDMLEDMKDGMIANVCKRLLLPSGLNLRNLVWHGFIEEHEALRPWLALILAILQILGCPPLHQEPLPGSLLLRNTAYVSERCRTQLDALLKDGASIREAVTTDGESSQRFTHLLSSSFIPPTHMPLLRQALDLTRLHCPALASFLLVVVLEHSLRLLWCKANNRPDKAVARSGCYYVTLDGHGQRSKHDVILHYDCDATSGDETETNKLADLLGASTMSLLTDLFISGCGGPNLRAALAHGVQDGLCSAELRHLHASSTTHADGQTPASLSSSDPVDVLLVAIDLASSVPQDVTTKKKTVYVPLFSFAATTADSIHEFCAVVTELKCVASAYTTDSFLPEIELDKIRERSEKLLNIQAYYDRSGWSVDDLFEERVVNEMLLPLTAARALICDTLKAGREFLAGAKRMGPEKPRMKTKAFHVTRLSTFALYVALCHMECPSDTGGRKMVERTRMVVSTVASFIFVNDQRSYKALETFVKGKLTKELISKSAKE